MSIFIPSGTERVSQFLPERYVQQFDGRAPKHLGAPLSAELSAAAYYAVKYAGTGYLSGCIFSLINPIGSAVYGAASVISEMALVYLGSQFELSGCLKSLFVTTAFFASMAIGALVTTSIGFPITFAVAIDLTLAMIMTTLAMKMALFGAKCAAACIGGGVLVIKDRFV